MKQLLQPTQLNQRNLILDILKGWALLGVVWMNYTDFFEYDKSWVGFKWEISTTILYYYITGFVFTAKSWSLLSLLFGYGFAVLMHNIKEKGHNPYSFFAGRMFWLFMIGIVNSFIFFGDILKDYAVLGLLLLLFYRSSVKTIFTVSLIIFIAIPAITSYVNALNSTGWAALSEIYHLYTSNNLIDVLHFGIVGNYVGALLSAPYLYTVHIIMFCCFLWGFSLYKIDFFTNIVDNKKYIKRAFWLSLTFTVFSSLMLIYTPDFKAVTTKYYNLKYWIVLSTMIFIVSSICWLYINKKCQKFFAILAVMGRMTLTNYIIQNIISLFIFSGFGFGVFNTAPFWFYVVCAVTVYILQIFFSKWWLSKYNYGPVEWAWRSLSYRKKIPFKKETA